MHVKVKPLSMGAALRCRFVILENGGVIAVKQKRCKE